MLPTHANEACDLYANGKRDLSKNLPAEIWHIILRMAIILPWPSDRFMPPPDDLSLIDGFSKTSMFCSKVAAGVCPESVVVVDEDAPQIQGKLGFVKHLRIEYSCTDNFLENGIQIMEQCSQLVSLSLSCFATYELYHIRLPSASTLVRLDWMAITTREDWTLMRFDIFPCLEELRLGLPVTNDTSSVQPFFLRNPAFRDETEFANRVLELVIPLKRLRYLSLRFALDDSRDFYRMLSNHKASLYHLEPSEGYERHYSDCPSCTEDYDHLAVVRAEMNATRIIVDGVPSLQRISWTNAWKRERIDEGGQRSIKIVKIIDGLGAPGIELMREDGP